MKTTATLAFVLCLMGSSAALSESLLHRLSDSFVDGLKELVRWEDPAPPELQLTLKVVAPAEQGKDPIRISIHRNSKLPVFVVHLEVKNIGSPVKLVEFTLEPITDNDPNVYRAVPHLGVADHPPVALGHSDEKVVEFMFSQGTPGHVSRLEQHEGRLRLRFTVRAEGSEDFTWPAFATDFEVVLGKDCRTKLARPGGSCGARPWGSVDSL